MCNLQQGKFQGLIDEQYEELSKVTKAATDKPVAGKAAEVKDRSQQRGHGSAMRSQKNGGSQGFEDLANGRISHQTSQAGKDGVRSSFAAPADDGNGQDGGETRKSQILSRLTTPKKDDAANSVKDSTPGVAGEKTINIDFNSLVN